MLNIDDFKSFPPTRRKGIKVVGILGTIAYIGAVVGSKLFPETFGLSEQFDNMENIEYFKQAAQTYPFYLMTYVGAGALAPEIDKSVNWVAKKCGI